MPISVDEYQSLKAKVDNAKTEADKASGALERAKAELKREYGCDSLDEANKLLRKMEKEEKRVSGDYNKALDAFEAEWADFLKSKKGEAE